MRSLQKLLITKGNPPEWLKTFLLSLTEEQMTQLCTWCRAIAPRVTQRVTRSGKPDYSLRS